jgi:hypothetical protein
MSQTILVNFPLRKKRKKRKPQQLVRQVVVLAGAVGCEHPSPPPHPARPKAASFNLLM